MSSPDTPPSAQAAIVLLYPLLKGALFSTYHALATCIRIFGLLLLAIGRPIFAVVRTILAPVLFLLSPFTFAAQLMVDITLRKPYSLASAVGEELYELWVFVGVCVLVGILVGFVARSTSQGIIRLVRRVHAAAYESGSAPTLVVEARPPVTEERVPTRTGNVAPAKSMRSGKSRRHQEWRRV
jgi:hypothetical protein